MLFKSDTEEDERPERKPRTLNKSKARKPPKRIIPIKNKDKVGHESWTQARARDIGNFPSPARGLLLGACGVGKSLVCKNLILHARPKYQEIYLIHEDARHSLEYEDCDLTAKLDDVPPIEYWEYEGPFRKRLCIIDDLEMTAANKERLKNLAIMFRYVSTHKSLSLLLCHQSFFDLPPLIKKMANIFIIWRPRATNEINLIENRVGMPKGLLSELFDTVATGHRDSICIDLTENSPAKLRLNIWNKIQISESSDESESSEEG
jgi:hypothetical protein